MTEESNRIRCPNCGANNFPSSATCWQCGQPLQAQGDQQPGEQPAEGAPPPPPPPPPPGGYQPPPSPYPPAPPAQDTTIYIILGFVFAFLGIFCCPIIFSIAAIIMGVIANSKGNPLGIWVIVAGVLSLIIGMAAGAFFMLKGFRMGQNPWQGPWQVPR